jgi:hypothetical protein
MAVDCRGEESVAKTPHSAQSMLRCRGLRRTRTGSRRGGGAASAAGPVTVLVDLVKAAKYSVVHLEQRGTCTEEPDFVAGEG